MTYKQSLNIQNFQLGHFEGRGIYDFPAIAGTTAIKIPDGFIGFGERIKDYATHGCHFFLDDYRIQRVWNNPLKYVEMLRRYAFVLSPDFSLYVDYPVALSIYNNYRKNWCARFWQENGIQVIPTIRWMYEDSYDWCFDGAPVHSVVAVSSCGICNDVKMIDMFLKGYNRMIEVLEPTQILWFGKQLLDKQPDNVVLCKTSMDERISYLRNNHTRKEK